MEQTHGKIAGGGQNAAPRRERKNSPPLVAVGGALMAVGLGATLPWVVVGGIAGWALGYWADKSTEKTDE